MLNIIILLATTFLCVAIGSVLIVLACIICVVCSKGITKKEKGVKVNE